MRTRSLSLAGTSAIALIALLAVAAPFARAAEPPRVIRTFTHHQITAIPQGVSGFIPIVSDSGNRILFGVNPTAEGRRPGLAAIDFDGGNLAVLEENDEVRSADISADGAKVVYQVTDTEIRIIGSDGRNRRTLLAATGGITKVCISGNGRTVLFLIAQGSSGVKNGDKVQALSRGLYAMSADGGSFGLVAGPEQVARLRGIKPEEAGKDNFCIVDPRQAIDISYDGRRVIFGCYVKVETAVFGCDIDGNNLHTIIGGQPPKPGEWYDHNFSSIPLSADGSTMGYLGAYPDELGVVGFDGKNRRVLMKDGEDPAYGIGRSEPVYLTADGVRLTHRGRLFNTDGSGAFQLMKAHQEGILRYWEYEMAAMDVLGRRFAYWAYTPRPAQLATMELNVPLDGLRSALRLTELTTETPSIPRQKHEVLPPRTSARVQADPTPPLISASGFKKGVYDDTLTQGGRVGITDMFDDGKADASGDAKAADGVFTGRWLSAYPHATVEPPRSIRFEAQIQDARKLYHAYVVEVGTYPIVEGKPEGGPVSIDGTPPPPPTVNPLPPGMVGPTNPPVVEKPVTPPVEGAIDLTGYWKTEVGDSYYARQIGTTVYWSLDGLPRVRNVFVGSIAGNVLTGTWADLPGGAIETNTGTIKLTIDSNNKFTKTSSTIEYTGTVWTRTGKPAGPGGGGPGVPVGPGPGATAAPWQTPEGRALIDKWIVESMAKLNAHKGGDQFNARKPYSINKYGLLEGRGLSSAFAPDNFKDYANDRYWYMWDYWVPAPSGWRYPEFNAAGVESLRDYVLSRLPKK